MGHFTLEIKGTSLIFLTTISTLKVLFQIIFKTLVLRLIYKKGSLLRNPINILILLEEVEHLVLQILLDVQTIYILGNRSIEETHGQNGCLFLHIFVAVSGLYTTRAWTGRFYFSEKKLNFFNLFI